MQRFMLWVIVISIFLILTCSIDNTTSPEIDKNAELAKMDQFQPPLEMRDSTFFNGTSTTTAILDPGKIITLPNGIIMRRGLVVQTDDASSDTRVSGIVTWIVNMNIYPDGTDKRWGTGELIIPGIGKWIMPYKGWADPINGITYEVDGHGKGDLRGLKAHWTYRRLPGVTDFTVNGYIVERNQ